MTAPAHQCSKCKCVVIPNTANEAWYCPICGMDESGLVPVAQVDRSPKGGISLMHGRAAPEKGD